VLQRKSEDLERTADLMCFTKRPLP